LKPINGNAKKKKTYGENMVKKMDSACSLGKKCNCKSVVENGRSGDGERRNRAIYTPLSRMEHASASGLG
jgi:hypothetical protein